MNFTLPEQVLSAQGVDLARAVIPTPLYNIPDYQNTFYYSFDGQVQSLVLTNDREFDEILDLVNQLNTDAVAQGKPITFSYNTTTRRIQITTSNVNIVTVTTNNNRIPMSYAATPISGNTNYGLATIPVGTYTKTAFLSALGSAITNVFATVPGSAIVVTASIDLNNVITLTCGGSYTGTWYINSYLTPYPFTQEQIIGYRSLLGLVLAGADNAPITGSFTFPNPSGVYTPVFQAVPENNWPTEFALNVRLGLSGAGVTAVNNIITGGFLPNILRTRVVYVCTNLCTNDTLSPTKKSDSIRSAIAKIPVNSTFGGMTLYQNNDFNWCSIVASTVQNIEIYLLDENLQPYDLHADEVSEFEFVFRYDGDNNN